MTTKNKLFDPKKFYIVRADKAGVFMAKISFIEGNSIGVNSFRRLHYWNGALDVSQIAKSGVSKPDSCKFSEQLGADDLSVISNLIEFHPMTETAIESLNNVPAWKS